MARAEIYKTERTNVTCGNSVSNIAEALQLVANGAHLIGASMGLAEVELVFERDVKS